MSPLKNAVGCLDKYRMLLAIAAILWQRVLFFLTVKETAKNTFSSGSGFFFAKLKMATMLRQLCLGKNAQAIFAFFKKKHKMGRLFNGIVKILSKALLF